MVAIQSNAPSVRGESPAAKLRNVDWSLTAFVLLLVPIGIIAIYSATRSGAGNEFVFRQGLFLGVGLILMALVASLDYRAFRDFLGVVYIITALALVLVLFIGKEVSGTTGWFVIFGFSIQPAEFAKLSLIIAISAMFTGRTGSVEAPRIVSALGALGAVAFLVLLEGETGSILVYGFIALGIFLIAGVPARVLLLLLASGAVMVSVLLSSDLLAEYQQDRLTSFIDAESNVEASYNQRQSETAVGSGGLTGLGLFEGPQTQLGFVPEQRTDFIFTVVAEELGFIGGAVILGLEALILLRIFRVAQLARDSFGTLICIGVFSMLLIQVFQNVGMTMRLMPITGIPLPFVSYGGSSLITSLIGIGLVQSVAIHRHRGKPVE